jgi:hypothetical protein
MTPAEQRAKSWIYSQRALRIILPNETSLGVFDHKGSFITMIDLEDDFDAGMRELWNLLWKAAGKPPYEKEVPKIDLGQLFGE